MKLLPVLPLGHYELVFRPRGPLRFTQHAGFAWRGAFGHALKRTVCVTREPTCNTCLLFRSCPYPYLFETPPPAGSAKMRRYTAVPHPFVIAPPPPGLTETGGEYRLRVILFGRANAYLPYVVHALARAGQEGLGTRRSALDLAEIRQEDGSAHWHTVYEGNGSLYAQPPFVPAAPDVPASITLTLTTPLRLKRDGDNVTPERFRFADLFASLLRRISLLTYFHTDTPLEVNFAGLTQAAREFQVSAQDLHWVDWTRYSSRQGTHMQLGGMVGTIRLQGSGLEPFWPYLWLGQWTHAGKATTMGLGAYRIGAASLPDDTAPVASGILGA
jgi:hypothetical protein